MQPIWKGSWTLKGDETYRLKTNELQNPFYTFYLSLEAKILL